jgi:hypothetical protein
MIHRMVRVGWVSLFALGVLTGADPAGAQVKARLHGGITQPVASTGNYFKFGPSVGVDVAYPVGERLDVLLDLGWDYLNTQDIYPTPTTNLWRYGVGVEGDLIDDAGTNSFLLALVGGVGATTIRSHDFYLESRRPYTNEGETINQTSLTANGGARLGLRTASDGITWWLTGKLNWLPLKDINQDALVELAREELDPMGSALSASVTLGVTLF